MANKVMEKRLYSKRKAFTKWRKFDKAFLESFNNALYSGGFSEVSFKLPHNLLNENQPDEISYEDFLKRERNYPSIILIAKNPTTDELVKVLFVNISTKTFFKDNTFPSGHSEPSELYVLSSPEKLLSLFGFYYSFFKLNNPAKPLVESLLGLGSMGLLFTYLLTYLSHKEAYFTSTLHAPLLDYISVGLAIAYLFVFFNKQSGLYVKEKEFRPAVWIKMAIKGEFRDNPVINLLVTLLGGVLAGLLLHLLGWT